MEVTMKIGNLVKHITQDKWGIIIDIIDFSSEKELDNDYIEVLWSDEQEASFIWDDLLKIVG